jgi:DNA-binding FadR family transcriptional regulator
MREQIAAGRLKPGERLPTEPEMCARSGLSRSTVREALRLLASQHLIVTTRGVTGGSFVAEPSAARLGDSLSGAVRLLRSGMTVDGHQFLEARELLEVPGAELAAGRRTDADLSALRGSVVDPDAGDHRSRLAAYWGFRAALAAAAHNPLLELLTTPLRQLTNDRELAAMASADVWRRVAADDRTVLDHVERRDRAAAGRATRAHLDYLRRLYGQDDIRLSG